MMETWTLRKLAIAAGLGAALFAAGWTGHGMMSSRADVPSVVRYGDWRVACPPRSDTAAFCQMEQDRIDKRSGRVEIRLIVSADPTDHRIDILVPFNVLLPAGLGVKLGDGPVRNFKYRTCNSEGCIVTITGDAPLQAEVIAAPSIVLVLTDLKGQTIPVTLTGPNKAGAAMRDMEARRHSWLRRVVL